MSHKVKSAKSRAKRAEAKPPPDNYERQDKKVLTNEPWYGTYEDGTVVASFMSLMRGAEVSGWRVCVWGTDDFGMERDFESRAAARLMFHRIVDLTTKAQLEAWGFTFV